METKRKGEATLEKTRNLRKYKFPYSVNQFYILSRR